MLRTRAPLYSGCPFRARLACVRHAASVRSEPGSNSPKEMEFDWHSEVGVLRPQSFGCIRSISRPKPGGSTRNDCETSQCFLGLLSSFQRASAHQRVRRNSFSTFREAPRGRSRSREGSFYTILIRCVKLLLQARVRCSGSADQLRYSTVVPPSCT